MSATNAIMHERDYARHSDVIVDEPAMTLEEINRRLADDYAEWLDCGMPDNPDEANHNL